MHATTKAPNNGRGTKQQQGHPTIPGARFADGVLEVVATHEDLRVVEAASTHEDLRIIEADSPHEDLRVIEAASTHEDLRESSGHMHTPTPFQRRHAELTARCCQIVVWFRELSKAHLSHVTHVLHVWSPLKNARFGRFARFRRFARLVHGLPRSTRFARLVPLHPP